jgi:hypothetical protein
MLSLISLFRAVVLLSGPEKTLNEAQENLSMYNATRQ